MKRLGGALLAFVMATVARPALAEPTASDRAAAQTLFEDGRKLMAKKAFAEACPKLEESERLDPAGGTLLHLASCYEGAGKLASAWSTFHSALSVATRDKRKDRADSARDHIAAIEPKLSKVAVDVPPEVKRLEGLEVRRNGDVIGAGQFGSEVPVDAGIVAITVTAKGRKPYKREITIGDKPTVEHVAIPMLEEGASEPSPPSSAPIVPEPPKVEQVPPPGNPGAGQRVAGLAVGATGLAIGIVGGVFGGLTIAHKSDASDHCTEANVCDAEGIAIEEEGVVFGTVSTIGFAVGGALLGTGIIVFATAPSASSKSSAKVAVGPSGVALEYAW